MIRLGIAECRKIEEIQYYTTKQEKVLSYNDVSIGSENQFVVFTLCNKCFDVFILSVRMSGCGLLIL